MQETKPQQKTNCKVQKRKNLKSRFLPAEIYLCVLGNDSPSSPRSLYMFTDHSRYLFNCGEGTQRLANEHKAKLSKLEDVFITYKSWENTSGLLGMCLTLQEMKVPELAIHGPPDIDLLFKCTESFVFLKDLTVQIKEFNETFQDDCMEVKKIHIFKKSNLSDLNSTNSEIYTTPSSNDDRSDEQASKKLRLSDCRSSTDVVIAFVCKCYSKPGTLMMEKCVELNVPVGPLLGDLKNGKDVTLPSGKVVCSKDVVSPEQVCPLFIVVECPNEEFLEPFVNEKEFIQYQGGTNTAALVVHFTPSEILKSTKYQEWMQRFPSDTCHLLLNKDCATLNSMAVHRVQHQLNLLHPKIFPLLNEKNENELNIGCDNVFLGRTLERYYLRPANGLDRTFALNFDAKTFIQEAMDSKGFPTALEQLQNTIAENATANTTDDIYPIVTFLGTGSSIPNKARNVSAILVNTSHSNCILLDCGEGTYDQLSRLFGIQIDSILSQLSSIFISHIHLDHNLGLIKILKEREKLFSRLKKKYELVTVIGPRKLNSWLRDFCRIFQNFSYLYRFIPCSTLQYDISSDCHTNGEIETSPDLLISTVPVVHCYDSHGIIVYSKSAKWKLVYSGDTMPCKKLITAGNNCSLLIHEATMEDELAEDAAVKKHSTTGEAIQVAKDMRAQYTILTHFSQRYHKVPLFNEKFHSKIGCAFDNMRVSPKEYYILPLLIPSLNTLFAEYVEELNERSKNCSERRRKKAEVMEKLIIDSLSENNVQVKK